MTVPDMAATRKPGLEVGIISDTHGLIRPELLEALEGVDRILHAGDLGPLDLLYELEAVAPVTLVYGNTDDFDVRERVPLVQRLNLEELAVVVTHGHQLGRPGPDVLAQSFPDADLVVFGHTHEPLVQQVGEQWFVNPGSCGPRRFELPVTCVRAQIAGREFRSRIVHLLTV